jgi:hypothetical protein
MEFNRPYDFNEIITFDFTCPFCSKKYTVDKSLEVMEEGNIWKYDFPDSQEHCEHILLYDSFEFGMIYADEIDDLEWFTRMSHLPFRVWDVLQEIINNDELPKGCEVRIRAFYVSDYIVFVFGNDAKALAHAVLEKTKEYIIKYNAQFPLDKEDYERFFETEKQHPIEYHPPIDFNEIEDVYKKLEDKLTRDDFRSKVEIKLIEMNGLCDLNTASMLVASEFVNDPESIIEKKSKNKNH